MRIGGAPLPEPTLRCSARWCAACSGVQSAAGASASASRELTCHGAYLHMMSECSWWTSMPRLASSCSRWKLYAYRSPLLIMLTAAKGMPCRAHTAAASGSAGGSSANMDMRACTLAFHACSTCARPHTNSPATRPVQASLGCARCCAPSPAAAHVPLHSLSAATSSAAGARLMPCDERAHTQGQQSCGEHTCSA